MRKLINPYLFIGLFSVPMLILSCSHTDESKNKATLESSGFQQEERSSGATSQNLKEQKSTIPEIKKKLIRTGSLDLKSQHIQNSKNRLDRALKSLDGYYDNEQFSKSTYEYRYSLKVRIPAKNFDRILQVINGGGDEIVSKNIQTEDVGAEYTDIETRLKSKRAYLARYEQFLTKANNMEELLQIQEQIRELIEEIESQEGRLAFLDDQVGYSTLNIELYKTISQPVDASEEPGFWEKAKNSLARGWTAIVVLFLGLLSIWPLLLILIPTGIFGYRKLKNSKKS